MRVAIVHDWLLGMRGGERCLEVLCELFPNADIYTAFYCPENITKEIKGHRIESSLFQRLPAVAKYYRNLLPLYPLVAKSIQRKIAAAHRAEPYDLMISVSHCLAKNVIPPSGVFHLCYCLTPMRYIWDHYPSYFSNHRLEPLIRLAARLLRRWDVEHAASVDRFVGISHYIAQRIERVYGREAAVVYPPVRNDWLNPINQQASGRADGDRAGCLAQNFLCVSALVPYKNVDLIIRTFNELPYQLTIVGSGPEAGRLRAMAGGNVRFVERVSDPELAELYRSADALVFAAEEDFGMTPVEMQASGRPVICYGRGGSLETVSGAGANASGVFFEQLTIASLAAAIADFQSRQTDFSNANCIAQAERFSLGNFKRDFLQELNSISIPGISVADDGSRFGTTNGRVDLNSPIDLAKQRVVGH